MRKSGIGWFLGVGLVAMLLAIGNLIYTCTRNNGEKYAQQYIDESEYVTLHIPQRKSISYERLCHRNCGIIYLMTIIRIPIPF